MFSNLKKAAAIAALPAAVPDVAPMVSRGGVRFNPGNQYVHSGPTENPAERLAGERDQALRDLAELRRLVERAEEKLNLSLRAPFHRGWTAVASREELAQIKSDRAALEQFRGEIAPTILRATNAMEKLNLRLRAGIVSGEED